MKRYMLHLHNTLPHTPKDATSLLHRARELVESKVTIRDARVSRKYIEFDTGVPQDMDVKTIVTKLETIAPFASYDEVIEYHMEKEKVLKRAVELFNDEKYWQAHEGLEYIWKNADGIEKQILNGMILVAAAFVHDEKDEQDVCISILQRARKKFDRSSGNYYGIDINGIADMISKIINTGKVDRFTI
jgi:uncharacterized protein